MSLSIYSYKSQVKLIIVELLILVGLLKVLPQPSISNVFSVALARVWLNVKPLVPQHGFQCRELHGMEPGKRQAAQIAKPSYLVNSDHAKLNSQ